MYNVNINVCLSILAAGFGGKKAFILFSKIHLCSRALRSITTTSVDCSVVAHSVTTEQFGSVVIA